jgi:hypothetical protein
MKKAREFCGPIVFNYYYALQLLSVELLALVQIRI